MESVQFHGDNCEIFFDDAADTRRKAPWVGKLCNLLKPHLSHTGGYPVHLVLNELFTARGQHWKPLLAQILVNMGRLLDTRVSAIEGSDDPVKALISVSGIRDEDALDALAMGEGVAGAAAYNPQALARDAAVLGLTKFSVQKRWQGIGRRYWAARRRDFKMPAFFAMWWTPADL